MKILDNINFDDIDFSKYKKEIDEINRCMDELKKNELLIKKIKEGGIMKVIDLLNKIANGEEVPRKIKYLDSEYEYNDDYKCYENFEEYFPIIQEVYLNDEIEIIEEEKEIEELPGYADIDKKSGLACGWSFQEKILKDKINELVREFNKLKKEGKRNDEKRNIPKNKTS